MVAGPKATVSNASVSSKDVQIGTVKGLPGDGNAITEGVALSTGSLIDPDPTADSDTDITRSAVLGPNDALDTTGDFGVTEDPAGLAKVAGTDVYDEASWSSTSPPPAPTSSFITASAPRSTPAPLRGPRPPGSPAATRTR